MNQERSIAGSLPSSLELRRLRREAEEMRVAYLRSMARRLFSAICGDRHIGAALPATR
ncbi:hypothetical protein [Azospirillum sp. TSO22-1]|uniref:hypothetical protein n=1 Tax=Azospirillum sp. TSO22-1 TaxID=716789 RepID=UPI0013048FD0|nr:hypothetical protein [Azospirillum sp. TSO22-1]